MLTGNPVRGGFARLPARRTARLHTVLVFGGSQGSRVLNRAVVAALPLPRTERARIVHQTGPAMHDEVAARLPRGGPGGEVLAFLDDMEARVAGADLVVSRSGATTCAELTAAGKAAVLVPFAQAADDHQRVNAAALEAAGAARMIEEKDLTGESLAASHRLGAAPRAASRRWRSAARALGAARRAPPASRTCWRTRVFGRIQHVHFVGHRRLGHERDRRGAAQPGLRGVAAPT